MSTQTEHIARLEHRLTVLLGKKSFWHRKVPCSGKYRGYYDYSLVFEDGSRQFIAMGRKAYLEGLAKIVRGYEYYQNHHDRLEELTRQVLERDNLQAVALGLEPVTLDRIELQDMGIDSWAVARITHMGKVHIYKETHFNYVCMGTSIGSDDPEAYFKEKISRPDEMLRDFSQQSENRNACIMFGYVRTWPEAEVA